MTEGLSPRSGWIPWRRILTVGAICLLVYGGVHVGLYYDDYHFMRPPLPGETHRVWFGSWDVTAQESVFFRPVTALVFLARFWLFGLNATVLYALSVTGHLVCALLLGLFVQRAGASRRAALFGACLYAAYPALPIAQVSWLTNQMHVLESLLVLSGLLAWQSFGADRRWMIVPVAAIAVTVFLVKEDGVMLLPLCAALGVLRWWRGERMDGRTAMLTLLLAATVVAALAWLRQDRLGVVGGYGVPSLDAAITNVRTSLENGLFLWPRRRPWQGVYGTVAGVAALALVVAAIRRRRRAIAVLLLVAGVLLLTNFPYLGRERLGGYPLAAPEALAGSAWCILLLAGIVAPGLRRLSSPALLLTGLAMVAAFVAPHLLVSKREQLHLVSMGAVVVGTAAFEAVIVRSASAVALAVGLLILSPLAVLARSEAAGFHTCSERVTSIDASVTGWWVVPAEVSRFLEKKQEACRAGTVPRLTDLDQAWWGMLEESSDEADRPARWTGDHAVGLLRADARRLVLEIRVPHSGATVSIDGRSAHRVQGPSSEWRELSFDLSWSPMVSLRQAHRVDISSDSWFVPDLLAGGPRRHGVLIRNVRVE